MSGLLLALVLTQTPVGPVCPVGQSVTADTAGHCCWPGQAWSVSRSVCVGVPTCPAEMVPSGDSCIAAAAPPPPPPPIQDNQSGCAPGAVLVQGICCWPGQTVKGGACVGNRTCPGGTVLQGGECVSRGGGTTPPPPLVESGPPPPPPVTTAPGGDGYDPIADRWTHLDRVTVATLISGDVYTLLFGAQLDLDVVIYRHRYFTIGAGVGAGFAWSWTATNFYSLYFPIYAQGGVRLGSSLSEFVIKVGGAPALVNLASGSGWVGKLLVGGAFNLRWSNAGAVVGFDLYLLNGVVPMATLGFSF